jgi:hypothetical protein
MARDPIVAEVRRIRDEIAKEHGYDLKAIVRALQRQESESGRALVRLPAKRIMGDESERKAG